MAVKKVQWCTRAPLQNLARQTLRNERQQKQVGSVNKKDSKAVIIAQEIKFARLLACNDKRIRDRVLKSFRKWLTVRSKSSFAFTETDFMRLWKGLFYCMWMSDKPLIQEELTESLSNIVNCFESKDVILLYTTCVLKTLGTEWFGIDQYRLDKFAMLVRRIIRKTFEVCRRNSWDVEWIKGIAGVLEKILLDSKISIGFSMHITDVFLEELSKISSGNISEDVVTELVKPFISYLVPMEDERQIRHVLTHIFRYLIFQSDVGMEYTEKFSAWKDAGFPGRFIDSMEKIELSDEEIENSDGEKEFPENEIKSSTEKPLDPRAGRVDVELPQIPFNPKAIVALLNQYKFHPSSTTKSRRQIRRLIREFTELSQGRMPLGVHEVKIPTAKKKDTDSKLAARRLLELDEELYSDVQKKRKRKNNGHIYADDDYEFDTKDSKDSIDDNMLEVDEIENPKKKKKITSKESTQGSDSRASISKKKKNERKMKQNSSNKGVKRNSNCKIKATSSSLNKNETNECKKTKLKKNKSTTTPSVNIITPVKNKKLNKPKVNSKWDISDNIVSSTPSPSNNNNSKVNSIPVKESIVNDSVTKNNIVNEQAWLAPVLKKLENQQNRTPLSSKQQHKENINSNRKKRVKIALQRNTAQHTSEYILQIQKSPAIPFDADKKPLAGVLKSSPIPSPINPFYGKKF